LNTSAPFTRLIYPVPESGGLGVHLTLDLAGRARFGPDVEPVCDENYTVDPARATSFHAAIRRYWPALPDNALVPDYSGIRPRVSINNRLYPDFLVQGPNEHGVSGLVNLLGMESPGLTASLAVAEAVAELLALTIHK
jgi:L-2-hydroxyglutarate oxidase LhgO